MKLDQSINEFLTPTVKMTFADMQRKLLGDFTSSVKALDISFDTFLVHANKTFGSLYPAQCDVLNQLNSELQKPNAVIDISSARQVGTTTSLLLLAYTQMMNNPHQTIVFLYPNRNMAREVCSQFRHLTKVMSEEHGYPEIFNKRNVSLVGTPYGGQVVFLNGSNVDALRGYTFSKLIMEESNRYVDQYFVECISPVLEIIGTDLITTNVGTESQYFKSDNVLSIKRNWDDNPNHDLEYFDRTRDQMPPSMFNLEMNL